MRRIKVDLGERKTKCRECGLWTKAGKRCLWCGSDLTSKPMVKVRCLKCERITYVDRAHLYSKNVCAWCGEDITVVRR